MDVVGLLFPGISKKLTTGWETDSNDESLKTRFKIVNKNPEIYDLQSGRQDPKYPASKLVGWPLAS